MKKPEIRKTIKDNVKNAALLTVYRKSVAPFYCNMLPLSVSKKLLMGFKDDDFQLNGYKIVRLKDINAVDSRGTLYNHIYRKECLVRVVDETEVRIKNWKSVFTDLQQSGKIIIVEKESLREQYSYIAVGCVADVKKKSIRFRQFDTEGVWQKKLLKIPFSAVTCISFGGRYEETFSKYVG